MAEAVASRRPSPFAAFCRSTHAVSAARAAASAADVVGVTGPVVVVFVVVVALVALVALAAFVGVDALAVAAPAAIGDDVAAVDPSEPPTRRTRTNATTATPTTAAVARTSGVVDSPFGAMLPHSHHPSTSTVAAKGVHGECGVAVNPPPVSPNGSARHGRWDQRHTVALYVSSSVVEPVTTVRTPWSISSRPDTMSSSSTTSAMRNRLS